MNRAGAAALVTAAARGFIQYHALEEAVPYWSYVLPFIHSLMGFGVFWALYRAAGWSGLGKSRCVRLADRYSFEMYLTHHIFILGAGRLHCMEVFSHPACNVLLVLAFTATSAWLLHFAARAAKRPPDPAPAFRSGSGPAGQMRHAYRKRADDGIGKGGGGAGT